jgi:hypothetical protein
MQWSYLRIQRFQEQAVEGSDCIQAPLKVGKVRSMESRALAKSQISEIAKRALIALPLAIVADAAMEWVLYREFEPGSSLPAMMAIGACLTKNIWIRLLIIAMVLVAITFLRPEPFQWARVLGRSLEAAIALGAAQFMVPARLGKKD